MSAVVRGDIRVRLAELLRAASIEIPARPESVESLHAAFAPGSQVFVSQPPGGDYRAGVATATAIRRAGFRPVAHVAARNLASADEFDDYLGRLVGEAGVDRVLLISGDRRAARGPYRSVIDVLASGRIEASGIGAVGIAGHPEGHPAVAAAELDEALIAKYDAARRAGLACFIVTQFCFAAAPILAYLARVERLGIAAPVRVGVAAPASVATLIRFAERCGVGASLDRLRSHAETVGGVNGESGPQDLLDELAAGLALMPADRVAGIHLYAFAGVAAAAGWLATTLAGLYPSVARKAAGG